MRVMPIMHSYPKLNAFKTSKNCSSPQTSETTPEIAFKGNKATWGALGGAIIGSLIAGPVGAALLGSLSAGYGAIRDDLDEDRKNGIDWSKMP